MGKARRVLKCCSCRPLTLPLGPGFYLCGGDARLCPVRLWDAVRHLQATGLQAILWQKPLGSITVPRCSLVGAGRQAALLMLGSFKNRPVWSVAVVMNIMRESRAYCSSWPNRLRPQAPSVGKVWLLGGAPLAPFGAVQPGVHWDLLVDILVLAPSCLLTSQPCELVWLLTPDTDETFAKIASLATAPPASVVIP